MPACSRATCLDTSGEHPDDPEHDPVLAAPWNHRGTVEVAVVLRGGGGLVKRRVFLSLAGPALTAPAHQWLCTSRSRWSRRCLVIGCRQRWPTRIPAMIAERSRPSQDTSEAGEVALAATGE